VLVRSALSCPGTVSRLGSSRRKGRRSARQALLLGAVLLVVYGIACGSTTRHPDPTADRWAVVPAGIRTLTPSWHKAATGSQVVGAHASSETQRVPAALESGLASLTLAPSSAPGGASVPLKIRLQLSQRRPSTTITVTVPAGWPLPSTVSTSTGFVQTSAGELTTSGREIVVNDLQSVRHDVLTVSYGGGTSGATEPTTPGTYPFSVTTNEGRGSVPQTVSTTISAIEPACATTAAAQQRYSAIPVTNGIAQLNLWNISNAAGSGSQCYSTTGLDTHVALTDAQANGVGPVGFPEVGFGYSLKDQPFCRSGVEHCPTGPFPLSISDLQQGPFDYSLDLSSYVPQLASESDLIFDLWLEHDPYPGSAHCGASTAPAGCPTSADAEVEIVVYHNGVSNCTSRATSLVTTIHNEGNAVSDRWRICVKSGSSEAPIIAFQLNRPIEGGRITARLPLAQFVDLAARYAHIRDTSGFDLMGIEFGSEFGTCSPASCTSTTMKWLVTRLALTSASGTFPIIGAYNYGR
jgi:hypothetical protein